MTKVLRSWGCLLLSVVGLLLLCWLGATAWQWARNASFEARFVVDTSSDFDVVRTFALAAAHNRFDLMRELLAADRQEFVDRWEEGHIAVSATCDYDWEDPDNSAVMGGSRDSGFRFWMFYSCTNTAYSLYHLTVYQVWLEETPTGWKIAKWDEICESRGADTTCYQ